MLGRAGSFSSRSRKVVAFSLGLRARTTRGGAEKSPCRLLQASISFRLWARLSGASLSLLIIILTRSLLFHEAIIFCRRYFRTSLTYFSILYFMGAMTLALLHIRCCHSLHHPPSASARSPSQQPS